MMLPLSTFSSEIELDADESSVRGYEWYVDSILQYVVSN